MLFTQHSVSTEFDQAAEQLAPSLIAIERLAANGVQTILTYPNNDAGGKAIIEQLEIFGATNIPGTQVRRSLGRHLYHGVLALARDPSLRIICVGNSSSGLKETPAFGCPTVNIGSRQEGRLRGENVLDTGYKAEDITAAMQRCLYDEDFRTLCRHAENPYWLGDAGFKIAEVLATVPLGQQIIRKRMTLKGEARDGWFR
jgi:UDP-N-acetylglucosamine 2-epimerase (non-hydrolysing)/GDP/UDP-N,N'-diacetylbacillosamine 2-epimerase (hydrolysing)